MADTGTAIPAASTAAFAEEAWENHSGKGKFYDVPDGVAGWSWGAFVLTWIWAVSNKTWLGLLVLVPGPCFVMPFVLGAKGREWAWQNRRWESVAHFQRVQREWSLCGVLLFVVPTLGIGALVGQSAYADHTLKQPLGEALQYANTASLAVGRHIQAYHAMPDSLQNAGIDAAPPAGVQRVDIDQQTGQLKVVLNVDRLHGQAFYLAPFVEADGSVTWRCLHGDIPANLLPEDCKYNTADPFNLPR